MGIVKVNQTGSSVPVYLTNSCNPSEQIGTIYNNEVFTWLSEWPGSSASGFYVQSIKFRNSSGVPTNGWIAGAQSAPIFSTNIQSMRYKTVTIGGVTYYAFKLRRNANLYNNTDGSFLYQAPKDRFILCKGSTSGASHPDRLAVWYLETGVGTNTYTQISSGTNAFVDMEYATSSMMGSQFLLIGSIG